MIILTCVIFISTNMTLDIVLLPFLPRIYQNYHYK
jgi:hypothetical protein